jgi:hypothetical protein
VFKTQLLPWLVHEVRSPIFNVKHPDGQTDEEIVAEVERKVVQMIGNYTHKEWECAQKILKHPGCVNRIFDELKNLVSTAAETSDSRQKDAASGQHWIRARRNLKEG